MGAAGLVYLPYLEIFMTLCWNCFSAFRARRLFLYVWDLNSRNYIEFPTKPAAVLWHVLTLDVKVTFECIGLMTVGFHIKWTRLWHRMFIICIVPATHKVEYTEQKFNLTYVADKFDHILQPILQLHSSAGICRWRQGDRAGLEFPNLDWFSVFTNMCDKQELKRFQDSRNFHLNLVHANDASPDPRDWCFGKPFGGGLHSCFRSAFEIWVGIVWYTRVIHLHGYIFTFHACSSFLLEFMFTRRRVSTATNFNYA